MMLNDVILKFKKWIRACCLYLKTDGLTEILTMFLPIIPNIKGENQNILQIINFWKGI